MVIAKINSTACYEKTITYVLSREKKPEIISHNLPQSVMAAGIGQIIKEFRETLRKAIAPYRIRAFSFYFFGDRYLRKLTYFFGQIIL